MGIAHTVTDDIRETVNLVSATNGQIENSRRPAMARNSWTADTGAE